MSPTPQNPSTHHPVTNTRNATATQPLIPTLNEPNQTTSNVPPEILAQWLAFPMEIRDKLTTQHMKSKITNNDNYINFMKDQKNHNVPQFTEAEISMRLGYTMNTVTKAFEKLDHEMNDEDIVEIKMLSPRLNVDGKLMTIRGEYVKVDINELRYIVEVLGLMSVYDASKTKGVLRHLVYIANHRQKIVKNGLSIISKISGIPRGLFPFDNGNANELIIGEFQMQKGHRWYDCSDGMWYVDSDLAKTLYSSEDLPVNRHWRVSDDFKRATTLILCEKAYIAKVFWAFLPDAQKHKYVVMVTGGVPSRDFMLMRKFLCIQKKLLTGADFDAHYWLGDVDLYSFVSIVHHALETNKHMSPSEVHLLHDVFIIGPFDADTTKNVPDNLKKELGKREIALLKSIEDLDSTAFYDSQSDRIDLFRYFESTKKSFNVEFIPRTDWFQFVQKRIQSHKESIAIDFTTAI